MLDRLLPAKPSDRLRRIGEYLLASTIVGAGLYYWVNARPADPNLDMLMPGYEKSRQRELGMLMGQSGILLADLQTALERPGTQALLIVAGGGLFSLYFFRAAWVLDEEERERREAKP